MATVTYTDPLDTLNTTDVIESMSDASLIRQIRIAEDHLDRDYLNAEDREIVSDFLMGLELELRFRMSSRSKPEGAPSFLDLAISMNAGSTQAAAAIGAMLTRGTFIVEG